MKYTFCFYYCLNYARPIRPMHFDFFRVFFALIIYFLCIHSAVELHILVVLSLLLFVLSLIFSLGKFLRLYKSPLFFVYILLFCAKYIRIVFLCNVITLLFLCFLIPLPPLLISVSTIFPQAFKQNCFYNFSFYDPSYPTPKQRLLPRKKFLTSYIHFSCEHSRKTASFYHEFFTAKKISLSLFPCTPPSRCKR